MAKDPSPELEGRGDTLPSLEATIEDLSKGTSNIAPARAVFRSVDALLAAIKDSAADKQDYIDLRSSCIEICQVLDRGLNGKRPDELNKPVLAAIHQLTTAMATLQKNVVKHGKRNFFFRFLCAKSDRNTVTGWKQDLARILQAFIAELAINTHLTIADMHRNGLANQGCPYSQRRSTLTSIPLEELPPPAPRNCFGRDSVIEELVGLAQKLEPFALIGAAGIGKTSIALTLLDHHLIKERFGDNRRFIRCDQIQPSRVHLLRRLSEVIGAGIENPADLAPLRPSLSSKEMILILDNAESILDPQGPDAQGINSVVKELSRFRNICLGFTSRIATLPTHCKRLVIPTLSMEAAHDTFHGAYGNNERSGVIDDLLQRLDFHALSITLLATAAFHNMWDHGELVKKWELHQTQALRTDYHESLAATIELSLSSPTFEKLGSNARDLLEVVAFFPQGINKKNLDWLFPTIPDIEDIFNKFCVLSLTHLSGNFITMLAPIRDHLRLRDPKSSPLLCTIKDRYFSRLSVRLDPHDPAFQEAEWIKSEDANVEHLLDVFIAIDPNSGDVWDACIGFIDHLYWHKKRLVVLQPMIEGLPDDHPSKPGCLFGLSQLFQSVGNFKEQKRLLVDALKLVKDGGDDFRVARTLVHLSNANRLLDLREEGRQQANEALKILERLDDIAGRARCHLSLACSLLHSEGSGRLGAAEEEASRAIAILPENGQEFLVCRSHHLLGKIYRSKGEKEKAIHHFKTALGIASPLKCRGQLFRILTSLAELSLDEGRFDEAAIHIQQAKSHAVDGTYHLGCAAGLQAVVWHRQNKLEEAKSEASHALEIFEKLGAVGAVPRRELLRAIAAGCPGRAV